MLSQSAGVCLSEALLMALAVDRCLYCRGLTYLGRPGEMEFDLDMTTQTAKHVRTSMSNRD